MPSEDFDGPDRFGCGSIAVRLLSILFVITLVLLLIMTRDGISQFVQSMLQGQQAAQGNGPGEGSSVPPISERYFDSGTTHASVSGDWSFSSDLAINDVASYVDSDGLAWISFGAYGDPTEVLISLNEPENSLTVADGATSATGIDDECVFTVTVTSTLVSGRVACSALEVLRGGEPAGTVSIDIQFSAGSPPAGSEPSPGVDG